MTSEKPRSATTPQTTATEWTLTPEEQRHVDEIDHRFGPDPQPKNANDEERARHEAWFAEKLASMENEIEIRTLRGKSRGRARVEKGNGGTAVVPVRNTPSGYQELTELLRHVDVDLARGILDQLGTVSKKNGDIDEESVNFLLSFIKTLKPRDGVEALLAFQMAIVHQASVEEAARLNRAETWQGHDSFVRGLTQLNRTYVAQTDALKHYRTGGEQKVTVQHVSVNDGGQAIVAQVTQSPPAALGSEPISSATLALPSPQGHPMEILSDRPAVTIKNKKASRA